MALTAEVGTIAVTAGNKNVTFTADVAVKDENGIVVAEKSDTYHGPDGPALQANAQTHFVKTATDMLANANADRAAATKYAGLRAAIKTALEVQ